MKRELSPRLSKIVPITTFITLGILWAMAIREAIRFFAGQNTRSGPIPLILFGILTFFFIRQIVTHKDVSIDDQYLYVRSRKTEIQIPLSEMKKVHYSIFRKAVVITLKSPTVFGERIRFAAEPRWGIITEPKIVEELRGIINAHSKNRTSDQSNREKAPGLK